MEPYYLSRRAFLARTARLGAGIAGAGIVVAACGGDDEEAAQPPPTPAQTGAPDLSGSGEVVVFDFGGASGAAVQKAYNDPFEEMTGITVVPKPQAPAGQLKAEVEAGAPSWDVFDLNGGFIEAFSSEDVLVPIDYSFFNPEDRAAIEPVPPHEFGVPNIFYSMVLAYDPTKVGSEPPTTWADFWDVEKYPGKRSLAPGAWGSAAATQEIALLADGVSPDALYPLDLDRVFASLDELRPDILKFWEAGAEPLTLIANGDVVMASAYNGRVVDLMAEGASIDYSPEQQILQYDYWVVPRGAENPENAMKWIAFASQAENQAAFANEIAYGPSNTAAYEFISSERAPQLPTAPGVIEKAVPQDYSWWSSEASAGKTNEQVAIERWEEWIVG